MMMTHILIWRNIYGHFFLNNREGEFQDGRSYHIVATAYMEEKSIEWFKKLDLIEFTVKYLYAYSQNNNRYYSVYNTFVKQLNQEFERLYP